MRSTNGGNIIARGTVMHPKRAGRNRAHPDPASPSTPRAALPNGNAAEGATATAAKPADEQVVRPPRPWKAALTCTCSS